MQDEYLKVIAAGLAYPIVRERRIALQNVYSYGKRMASWAVSPDNKERHSALYDREKDLLAIITETDL